MVAIQFLNIYYMTILSVNFQLGLMVSYFYNNAIFNADAF